ncbi:MAG: AAA family ATPase [Candidatus Micrarchaeia archaeon]
MAKLIIVLGTQGAGKSSVLAGVSGTVRVVNIGDEMLKLAAGEYGINDRDKMRQMPGYAEKSEQWRKKIFSGLAAQDGIVIVDTHASIKAANRYTPGLALTDLEAIRGSAAAIVYVDASTEEILKRRESDKTRNREQDTAEEISQHRSINLSLASFFSAYLNIPLYVIYNKEGELQKAQEKLKSVFQEIGA